MTTLEKNDSAHAILVPACVDGGTGLEYALSLDHAYTPASFVSFLPMHDSTLRHVHVRSLMVYFHDTTCAQSTAS